VPIPLSLVQGRPHRGKNPLIDSIYRLVGPRTNEYRALLGTADRELSPLNSSDAKKSFVDLTVTEEPFSPSHKLVYSRFYVPHNPENRELSPVNLSDSCTYLLKTSHSPSLAPLLPKCPACNTEIDHHLFDNYLNSGDTSLATRAALCPAHNENAAQAQWERLGYPTIDWETFPQRLDRCNDEVGEIISKGVPLRYKEEFDRS